MVIVALALSTSSSVCAQQKRTAAICEQHIKAASEDEGIPIGLLYAVATTESGSGGRLQPYALNIEGEPLLVKTRAEALSAFESAREDGKKLIDLGCMQINYHYHHSGFSSASDMLDPQKNVHYAAKHLKSLQIRHGTWTEAVARYHAGPKNKSAQNRYVCKVIENLVKANFGSWTSDSLRHCNPKLN